MLTLNITAIAIRFVAIINKVFTFIIINLQNGRKIKVYGKFLIRSIFFSFLFVQCRS